MTHKRTQKCVFIANVNAAHLEVSIKYGFLLVELLEQDDGAVLGFVVADDVTGRGDGEDDSIVACGVILKGFL